MSTVNSTDGNFCADCGLALSIEHANKQPRPACPRCGGHTVNFRRSIHETLQPTADLVSVALTPGRQTRGWQDEWQWINEELKRLQEPRQDPLNGSAIKKAEDEFLRFFSRAYHLADALIADGLPRGLNAKAVRAAVHSDPDLALLTDLANLGKHFKLLRRTKTNQAVSLGARAGVSMSGGWGLQLAVRCGSRDLEVVSVARDSVGAWESLLRSWGLL